MSKRKNGQGSITRRKDGRFMVRFTVNGEQKLIYTKSEAEANRILKNALADIQNDRYIDPNSLTLEQWLTEWLEIYTKPTVRQSTYANYEGNIRNHVNPQIGKVKLNELDSTGFQVFFNNLQKGNVRKDSRKGSLSAKTIRNISNMLNAALDQAVAIRKLSHNPLVGIKLPKLVHHEMRVLTISEQQNVFKYATASDEIQAFGIILTLYTGMRIGELVGLQWKDLNADKKEIRIRRTVARITKHKDDLQEGENTTEIVIGDPKTGNSIRNIPLSSNVWDMLMDYKKKQRTHFRLLEKNLSEDDYMFCGETGDLIEPRTYSDLFERIQKVAKIEKANYHALRHTFATRALEAGMDIKVLSSLLGHAQCSTTLDR